MGIKLQDVQDTEISQTTIIYPNNETYIMKDKKKSVNQLFTPMSRAQDKRRITYVKTIKVVWLLRQNFSFNLTV